MKEFMIAKEHSDTLEDKIHNIEVNRAGMQDKLQVAKKRFEELREEVKDLGFEDNEIELILQAVTSSKSKPKKQEQEVEKEDSLKK
jgi:phosphosulfolactate synthase (CoM biosynthesis protein A)